MQYKIQVFYNFPIVDFKTFQDNFRASAELSLSRKRRAPPDFIFIFSCFNFSFFFLKKKQEIKSLRWIKLLIIIFRRVVRCRRKNKLFPLANNNHLNQFTQTRRFTLSDVLSPRVLSQNRIYSYVNFQASSVNLPKVRI